MSWCVVGAGWTGVAMAAALLDAGLEVDVLDRAGEVGGLWLDGVYDSVRLITTRRTSSFDGFPMPEGTAFPSGPELLAYLRSYAATCSVEVTSGTVESVAPDGPRWTVTTGTGNTSYDGVVLATGLFQRPFVPTLPGTLDVPALHTRDYRNADQLGQRVLVVGLGNSGADVAQDAVRAGRQVVLSVAEGRHVVPRRVLGRAAVELERPAFVPDLPVRVGLDLLLRALSRSDLPAPRHLVLSQSPVVHSAILGLVRSGDVQVRPAVVAVDGSSVSFADGTAVEVDTVVWATGYTSVLPVERALVDGTTSGPVSLVAGLWSPVSRGLAVPGLREPRHGRGPYLSAVGRLLAAGALAQARLDLPVGAVLAQVVPPTSAVLVDNVPERRRLQHLTAVASVLQPSLAG